MKRQAQYTLRVPLTEELHLRCYGPVLSRHHKLARAWAAWARHVRGCSRHGGYSRAYVWDEWEEREAERPAETG